MWKAYIANELIYRRVKLFTTFDLPCYFICLGLTTAMNLDGDVLGVLLLCFWMQLGNRWPGVLEMCRVSYVILFHVFVSAFALDHGEWQLVSFNRRERVDLNFENPQQDEIAFIFAGLNCTSKVELISNSEEQTKRSNLFGIFFFVSVTDQMFCLHVSSAHIPNM